MNFWLILREIPFCMTGGLDNLSVFVYVMTVSRLKQVFSFTKVTLKNIICYLLAASHNTLTLWCWIGHLSLFQTTPLQWYFHTAVWIAIFMASNYSVWVCTSRSTLVPFKLFQKWWTCRGQRSRLHASARGLSVESVVLKMERAAPSSHMHPQDQLRATLHFAHLTPLWHSRHSSGEHNWQRAYGSSAAQIKCC